MIIMYPELHQAPFLLSSTYVVAREGPDILPCYVSLSLQFVKTFLGPDSAIKHIDCFFQLCVLRKCNFQ